MRKSTVAAAEIADLDPAAARARAQNARGAFLDHENVAGARSFLDDRFARVIGVGVGALEKKYLLRQINP